MKIYELIKELNKCNPNLDVSIAIADDIQIVTHNITAISILENADKVECILEFDADTIDKQKFVQNNKEIVNNQLEKLTTIQKDTTQQIQVLQIQIDALQQVQQDLQTKILNYPREKVFKQHLKQIEIRQEQCYSKIQELQLQLNSCQQLERIKLERIKL